MGANNQSQSSALDDLTILHKLGDGVFGPVMAVQWKKVEGKTKDLFAMVSFFRQFCLIDPSKGSLITVSLFLTRITVWLEMHL
jgi:hypothetical protein